MLVVFVLMPAIKSHALLIHCTYWQYSFLFGSALQLVREICKQWCMKDGLVKVKVLVVYVCVLWRNEWKMTCVVEKWVQVDVLYSYSCGDLAVFFFAYMPFRASERSRSRFHKLLVVFVRCSSDAVVLHEWTSLSRSLFRYNSCCCFTCDTSAEYCCCCESLATPPPPPINLWY